MTERTAVVTDQDVAFLRLAKKHYGTLAEALERKGEDRAAGRMRAQEFYAERFLARLEASHA